MKKVLCLSVAVVLSHTHVADSYRQAEHLLHLELDGGLEVEDLGIEVVRVSHQRGELPCLVETRAQKPWDLLDESVRGEEGIILLGQALHLLLVLVQLLQVISRHEVNSLSLCLVAMLLISQQTNLELLARDMLQLDGARETLVLLGIIVLQANLEVNSLLEFPWLVLGSLKNSMDRLKKSLLGDL